MNWLDTVFISDDPVISKSIRERYPSAQHRTYSWSSDRRLYVSVIINLLCVSTWSDGCNAAIVVGAVKFSQSTLRAVTHPSLTVAHADTSQLTSAHWVVVANDGAVRIQGDPIGITRVYWATTRHGFVACNRARAIARLLDCDVDPTAVAMRLFHPLQYRLWSSPCWRDIQGVQPGEYLEVTDQGGLQRVRWWELPTHSMSLDTSARTTTTALFAAIRMQLAGRTTASCDVSGGLDSCSVTTAAARIVEGEGGSVALHGWTSLCRDEFNSDAAWAREFLKSVRLDSHRFIPPHEMPSRYDDLAGAAEYELDEPSIAMISHRRLTRLTDLARDAGSQVHFTGYGGDEIFNTLPVLCADQLRVTPRHAVRNLLGWRAMGRWPMLRMLRQLACGTSYAKWLATDALHFGRADQYRPFLSWGVSAAVPPWLTIEAAQGIREHTREVAESAVSLASTPGRHLALDLLYQGARLARAISDIAAQRSGLLLVAPLLDAYVVSAALSVEAGVRSTPYQYKPVLTRGLHGLLPDAVLARRSKGGEDADVALGFVNNLGSIRELWMDSRLVALGVVNGEYLRAALCVPDSPEFDNCALGNTLAAEVWLRSLEHDRKVR
jgi:asparagine synthase (glutamine-hydrolysing)